MRPGHASGCVDLRGKPVIDKTGGFRQTGSSFKAVRKLNPAVAWVRREPGLHFREIQRVAAGISACENPAPLLNRATLRRYNEESCKCPSPDRRCELQLFGKDVP
jgi:hypothetical protein